MLASPRPTLAKAITVELRAKEGRNLMAVAVYGSVAQRAERKHSDMDLLLIVRRKRHALRAAIEQGVLVTFLPMTPEEAKGEVAGAHENLPEALSGWRSMRPLYDPTGLIRKLKVRARRPTASQFRESARLALLATFEDYGKLRNAIEEGDAEEAREMAIWFTGGAVTILFCLDRHVPATGRRLFADVRRRGRLGNAICSLRYEELPIAKADRLSRAIWKHLLLRARRQRIAVSGMV